MPLTIYIIFLLIFPSWIIAEDITNKDVIVVKQISLIFVITIASILGAISLISLTYFIIRFFKKKMFEPQYYIDDTLNNKDNSECYIDNNNIDYQPSYNINQIQPILSVSFVVSSIKQALQDLGDNLIPANWSRVQYINNQPSSVNKNMDLPI